MGKDKQLKPEELQAAAKQLGVNNPIMAHKVVGNRVELHLLGGAVVKGPTPTASAPVLGPTDLDSLSRYTPVVLPWPIPMHMVETPRVISFSCMTLSSDPVMRVPEQPKG